MPKYGHYCCPACDFVERDHPVPFGTTFSAGAPFCPICKNVDDSAAGLVKMDWIPQIGRMSAGNGPTFTKFECHDATGRRVTVDSISALRAIERESEKMAADGRGEGRMVWRDLANDRSNRDDHAITKAWEPADYPGTPTTADFAKLRMVPEAEARERNRDAVAPLQLPPE